MRVLSLLCLLASTTSIAQAAVAHVGRGRAAAVDAPLYYSSPSPDDAGATRVLYPKAALGELPPNVPITAIEFDKRQSGEVASGSFTIMIKNSTATTLANAPLSAATAGATEVYTTTVTAIPTDEGWVRFDFASPFTYTGDALEIVTLWDSNSGARALPVLWGMASTGLTFQRLLNYGPDPLPPSTTLGTTSTPARPNTRFIYTPPALPWCAAVIGDLALVNGGFYGNPAGFANGVTLPSRIHLVNVGGVPMTFPANAITFTGVTGVTTAVVTAPTTTLQPGESVLVEISHTTIVASGAVGYTVNIASNAGTFTYSLSGNAVGTETPEVDMFVCDQNAFPDRRCTRVPTGGHIYVGQLEQKSQQAVVIEFQNTGAGTLANGGLVSSNPECTFGSQLPSSNGPGTELVVTLTCAPTTLGASGTAVTTTTNDATEPNYILNIDYTVVEATTEPLVGPRILLDAVSMGPFQEDRLPHKRIVTVMNVGDEPLILSSFTARCGSGCLDYNTPTVPGPIAPGATVQIEVEFTVNEDAKNYAILVTAASNDTTNNPAVITLEGEVLPPEPEENPDPPEEKSGGCFDAGGGGSSFWIGALGVGLALRRRQRRPLRSSSL